MDKPRVTIITPCYNQRRFIGECIQSVLAQTFDSWEQVVVDDGSTDETPEIAASFADRRIRVLRLPHRGLGHLAASYNAAMAVSTGELVAVLEGDDVWPAHKLKVQVPGFADPSVFLSWGRAVAIDEHGRPIRNLATIRTNHAEEDFAASEMFRRLARTNIFAPAASVMIRRSALESIGGFQQGGSSFYVDLATWLTLTARTQGRVRFINRELAGYRIHSEQTTKRHWRSMDADHLRIVRYVAARLDEGRLASLDWRSVEREAATGALITEGRAALSDDEYGRARKVFAAALRSAATWPDRIKAGLGLLSSTVHLDLLGTALEAHASRLASRPERFTGE